VLRLNALQEVVGQARLKLQIILLQSSH